jgi:hypothetical protein
MTAQPRPRARSLDDEHRRALESFMEGWVGRSGRKLSARLIKVWLFSYAAAGGFPCEFDCRPVDLAAAFKKTRGEASRWIAAMIREGLWVRIKGNHFRLLDPYEVLRVKRPDPQSNLAFYEEPDALPMVESGAREGAPAHRCAQPRPFALGGGDCASPLPFDPLVPLVNHQGLSPGSAGCKSAPDSAPTATAATSPRDAELDAHIRLEADRRTQAAAHQAESSRPNAAGIDATQIGGAVRAAAEKIVSRLPGDGERQQAIGRLMARMLMRVPSLENIPAFRVADAIVGGRLPEKELDSVLSCMLKRQREKTLRFAPWGYFIGAMRRAFDRHGLDWPIDGTEPKK